MESIFFQEKLLKILRKALKCIMNTLFFKMTKFKFNTWCGEKYSEFILPQHILKL